MKSSGLRQVTLCLLVKDNQVLLAMKKRGFGVGKWNGVGGKLNDGETLEQAAIRESQEEIGVTPISLQRVAIIDYLFSNPPAGKNWDQQMNAFLVHKWEGEPVESEEMKPQWYGRDKIPYHQMWESDAVWMEKVLAGEKVKGEFIYLDENTLKEYKVDTTHDL